MKTSVANKKNKLPVFQERLNQLRGNLSQEEFAKKIGLSRPTVGFYENGDRLPDALVLKKIADSCGASVDWLLGLTDIETGNADDIAIEKRIGLTANSINNLRQWKAKPISLPYVNYVGISEEEALKREAKRRETYSTIADLIIGNDMFRRLVVYIEVYLRDKSKYSSEEATVDAVIELFKHFNDENLRDLYVMPEQLLDLDAFNCNKTAQNLINSVVDMLVNKNMREDI